MTEARDSTPSSDGIATTLDAGPSGPSDVALDLHVDLGAGFADRYQRLDQIGQGGMGTVHACRDLRIGRKIAMKVLRPERKDEETLQERFLREARIQGQLEHPAVLPVYDLGQDPQRALFFTMRRTRGTTLTRVITLLANDDPEARQRYPLHKRLGIFLQACQGVHYAHARGVLHRDLKPDNIMVGEFGEVYVLDWGLAKALGVSDPRLHSRDVPPIVEDRHPTHLAGILGTPGYLAPEQARPSQSLDRRCDVYSLGALLFELLALTRLHPGKDAASLVESTLAGADARISERAPQQEIPPELEAICVKATALRPEDRYETVRALHDAVERFLEGERNMELRRELASRHTARAAEAAARALSDHDPAGEARTRALQEVGRALALAPEDPDAQKVLARLVLEPPRVTPEEAAADMERAQAREAHFAARITGAMLLAGLVLVALMGLDRSGLRPLLPAFVAIGLGIALCVGLSRQARPNRWWAFGVLALTAVSNGVLSGFMGPLVLVPSLALAVAVVAMNLRTSARFRGAVVGVSLLSVAVPALLEMTGILPSSYRNQHGTLVVLSRFMEIPDRPYPILLLICSLLAIAVPLAFVWRLSRELARLRDRIQLYAWQFRQLVPEQARQGLDPQAFERVQGPSSRSR